MAEYEEKFIVINKKKIEELNSKITTGHPAARKLISTLHHFENACRAYDMNVDQKYYVVNQNESYAPNIIKFILDNETVKEEAKNEH